MLRRTVSLALVFAAAPLAGQDQDLSQVAIQTTVIRPGVAMLTGAGGNLGVAYGEDGVFLVDDQFAPLTDKIRAAVAALSDRPIRFLLNTHWHFDHTGGNENFGRAGVLIVAHDQVRTRMSVDQFIAAFDQKVPASPPAALPVVTFTDAVTFHLAGEEVHAFHVPPAHTDGDAVVVFRRADVLHMGDAFFNGFYPFIDVDAGGSIDGMIGAVDLTLPLVGPATRVIPGHGPLGDRAALLAYRAMLAGVRDAIAPLVAAGRSDDEILAAHPTAPWDETWGKGFLTPEAFTRIVAAGMRRR